MSEHHRQWVNGGSRKHRARIARTLPQPCARCPRPVLPTDAWEADHIVPLAQWPKGKPYPDNLIRPAHKSCNRAAGGRDGARITNAKKKAEQKGAMPW
ncbi:HNH endonuclease signature motif containing protein [Curtobacterium sp. A7_M15]|uniref:HNH endonuclease signature motif containing protein n=1 Tax=Curtobacterium sp. A7_M15 TaxID=3065241 RepID=UPI00351FBD56